MQRGTLTIGEDKKIVKTKERIYKYETIKVISLLFYSNVLHILHIFFVYARQHKSNGCVKENQTT